MTARALTAENSRRLLDATHPLISMTGRLNATRCQAKCQAKFPIRDS